MKPAIVVVDMLEDNVDRKNRTGIGEQVKTIIPNIQRLLLSAREAGFPIVFANDSYLREDPVFQGKMKPHAIRGTDGARVIDELSVQESDIIVEKRRFDAFFKTDLDMTLRVLNVDTIAVAGMSTEVCVSLTAWGGISNDFKVIILEDCCCSFTKARHEAVLNLYRDMPLYPLLRVMTMDEFLPLI
jgi:nicotinamidase-related amidase